MAYKRRYRRRKKYYKKKGKNLEGYKLSSFIYPYLIFINIVFWSSVLIFVYLAFSGPSILKELFWFLAFVFGLVAVTCTFQWWQQRRILNQAQTINALRNMDPSHFEYYIANLLRKTNFNNVKVMGGSGDRGVDIVAYKKKLRYVVQCKRYQAGNKVGSPEIQQFIGSIQIYRANKGIFVTTSLYTKEAKAIALQEGVHLVGETELAQLINKAFTG